MTPMDACVSSSPSDWVGENGPVIAYVQGSGFKKGICSPYHQGPIILVLIAAQPKSP